MANDADMRWKQNKKAQETAMVVKSIGVSNLT